MATQQQMTLAEYLAVVRRRKWLIIIAVLVSTGSALFFSSRQAKLYEASAQVLVNPDASLVQGASHSASDSQARFDTTQAELAHTPDVAKIAIKGAGVPGIGANDLIAKSSVSSDSSSNILNFAVSNANPAVAVKLVNAYVRAFTVFGSQVNAQTIQQAIDGATQSINNLSARITTARKAGSVPAGLQTELRALVARRAQYQQEKLAANANARVARYAQSATQTQPDLRKDAALGLMLGLVLGLVMAFLRESLDTRVRSSVEIANGTGLRLLARIPTPPRDIRSKNHLAVLSDKADVLSEPYQKLRVAIDFANLGVDARTIMVTSAVEREGKSTTVSNLAVVMARSGQRVVLVDLDLRKPMVADFFGLEGRVGITDIALGHARLEDALVSIALTSPEGSSSASGNGNGKPNLVEGLLEVLPAGQIPPNPADFLGSSVLAQLLLELRSRADVVLIDSPPMLPVADGITLSSRIDAIVVVAQAKLLRRRMLGELGRLLETCRAAKLGFVLTGAEIEDGYGYGYGYGGSDSAPAESSRAGSPQGMAR